MQERLQPPKRNLELGQMYKERLIHVMERRDQVSALYSGENQTAYIFDKENQTHEIEITLELHAALTNIILATREDLINAGFPNTAESIAPQSPIRMEPRVLFDASLFQDSETKAA